MDFFKFIIASYYNFKQKKQFYTPAWNKDNINILTLIKFKAKLNWNFKAIL